MATNPMPIVDVDGFTYEQLTALARYAEGRLTRAEHRMGKISPTDPRYERASNWRDTCFHRYTSYVRAAMAIKGAA